MRRRILTTRRMMMMIMSVMMMMMMTGTCSTMVLFVNGFQSTFLVVSSSRTTNRRTISPFAPATPPSLLLQTNPKDVRSLVMFSPKMKTTTSSSSSSSSRTTMTLRFLSSNDNNGEFFNDFGNDMWIGDDSNDDGNDTSSSSTSKSSSSATSSVLSSRMEQLQQKQILETEQTTKNWIQGHWTVRGFSLDPYDSNNDRNTVQDEVGTPPPPPPPEASAVVEGDDISSSSSLTNRGFSTTSNTDTDTNTNMKIIVTKLLMAPTQSYKDNNVLLVGRSDGSICFVQLSNQEYLAHFTHQLVATATKLSSSSSSSTTKDDDKADKDDNSAAMTIEISQQLQRVPDSESRILQQAQEQAAAEAAKKAAKAEAAASEEGCSFLPNDDTAKSEQFDVQYQFQALPRASSDGGISHMIVLDNDDNDEDDEDDENNHLEIIVADSTSGIIQHWDVMNHEGTTSFTSKCRTTYQIPGFSTMDQLIELQSITYKDQTYIMTITSKGILTLWNINSSSQEVIISITVPSTLIDTTTTTTSNMMDYDNQDNQDDDNDVIVRCGTVDSDHGYIYVGCQSGIIQCYSIATLIESSSSSSSTTTSSLLPIRSFIAYDNASVTSMTIAGKGQLSPTSISFVTGSSIGQIKQWELFERNNGTGSNRLLEYWPKMKSQKLPLGKPHILKEGYKKEEDDDTVEKEEEYSIDVLDYISDANLILSASSIQGDLELHSALTGDVTSRMAGLEWKTTKTTTPSTSSTTSSTSKCCPISICLTPTWLITNGMDQFVCIHDFSSTTNQYVTEEDNDNEDEEYGSNFAKDMLFFDTDEDEEETSNDDDDEDVEYF